MELYTDVARQYADFARHAGDSPCFREWSGAIAEDGEVLDWIRRLPPVKQQPNLVLAAARWHGVPAPGPYEGLRQALLDDDGTIRGTILARATQTNEVGRLATLVPWFADLARQEGDRPFETGAGRPPQGPPLALVEAGASAGLCLYPDRYSYRWATDHGVVEAGSGPLLPCDVSGPFPDAVAPPAVAWRGGVDLHPLDVADTDAMAWLENLVWPEQDARRERLRAAIEVTRADPPRLVTGDLLDRLPDLVAEAAAHGPVVVFHTAVIAYLEPSDRARFHTLMTSLVEAGRCHWVSNESPKVLPDVAATAADPGEAERPPFVLGVDGRAVAWTHGHGASMQVL